MIKVNFKALKEATEKLTEWESSKKAFGHFEVLTEKKMGKKVKVDRLFEFWCLMKILDDLRCKYEIELVSDSRSDKKVFPQSSGKKNNGWAYFKIKNKADSNNRFQVCYGTEIKLKCAPKTTFAPDISIQKHDATDDPDESMVELIMDAKFKYKTDGALPKNQLDTFIQWVKALETQNAELTELFFNSLQDIKANCLLTNGKALKNQEEYCKLNRIKQVERFDIKSEYKVIG